MIKPLLEVSEHSILGKRNYKGYALHLVLLWTFQNRPQADANNAAVPSFSQEENRYSAQSLGLLLTEVFISIMTFICTLWFPHVTPSVLLGSRLHEKVTCTAAGTNITQPDF